jgi:hypothetical protein
VGSSSAAHWTASQRKRQPKEWPITCRYWPAPRIGELPGRVRELQAEWTEEAIQRITTENITLKQRVRQLTTDNRTLDERLKAARPGTSPGPSAGAAPSARVERLDRDKADHEAAPGVAEPVQ